MKAEYRKGYRQIDSVEREGYAGAQSIEAREGRERDGTIDLMERILSRDNLNHAYKQVERNHGAPGIDGMTIEAALQWLREKQRGTSAKHPGRKLQAKPGAAQGNPQTRRKRSTKGRHPGGCFMTRGQSKIS